MSCESDEAARVASAVAGNQEALARLLIDPSGALTRRLSARIKQSPFADFSVEDVLQEVFLDVHRGIGTLRLDGSTSFAAWLNKVADNRLVTMLRQRSRVKRGGGRRQIAKANQSMENSVALLVQHLAVDDTSTASQKASREEVIQAVREQLAVLPADQRRAVEQRYLDEQSLNTTADMLQKTGGAVRGLLHRAKQTMRDALGDSSRWFQRK